ncbi:hypothetical protein ACUOFC_48445, partial [Escherichia sp. TWPC-MK]
MSKSKMIVRTKFIDRACHWTVVVCVSHCSVGKKNEIPDSAT